MAAKAPPRIFSSARRQAARRRMRWLQAGPDAARFLVEDMVEDVLERLAFLRHAPRRALVVGDFTGALAGALERQGAVVVEADPASGFDEAAPWPYADHDLVVSLGTLDTVNDLPGALVHARRALAEGGLFLASLAGFGSLPALRAAMMAADGDRAAPRLHPMVDVRAGAALLQRVHFADPVADSRGLDVAYRSLDRLVSDLRAQGVGNVLADPGPPLRRAALDRARAAFFAEGKDGRVVERFEILTLSGWKR